jgi:hypothetical protein
MMAWQKTGEERECCEHCASSAWCDEVTATINAVEAAAEAASQAIVAAMSGRPQRRSHHLDVPNRAYRVDIDSATPQLPVR